MPLSPTVLLVVCREDDVELRALARTSASIRGVVNSAQHPWRVVIYAYDEFLNG